MKKTAVIAGTPVDTQMGVDYIISKGGFEPLFLPCFDEPCACHAFQLSDNSEKEEKMTGLFEKGLALGAGSFFIYCNSLSAVFDFKGLGRKMGVKCVTPLEVYERLAAGYGKLAVIAANNQATAGIEKAFTGANPECRVMGLGFLELVRAVESKMPARELVEKFGLMKLIEFFKLNGAEALVLGCTHFPYFKKELSGIEIIDPAELMYEALCEGTA